MKIEVLIGMVASGKSTYARRRADEGALVIAHDSLTNMLHATYRYEQGLRECYRRMEEALVLCALEAGRDVVIDRTHLTQESRGRWLDFECEACRDNYQVVAVPFPIESAAVHARRRFEADPRGRTYVEWLAVAGHHAEQAKLEPLDWQAEGFDGVVDPATIPLIDEVSR